MSRIRNARYVLGSIAAGIVTLPLGASGQDIGRLYAARPPEGSAFVRVVSGLGTPVQVVIDHGGTDELAPDNEIASLYRIVPGDRPVALTVNGKPLRDMVTATAGSFVTVLLRNSEGTLDVRSVVDATGGRDDLKAELRVYNLVPGCSAAIAIQGGPAVFKDVAPETTQKRSINPVAADLVGRCGDASSSALTLPRLKPGDRFSLFLIGTVERPVLKGQVDASETYSGWTK